jgi:hypothetical protein
MADPIPKLTKTQRLEVCVKWYSTCLASKCKALSSNLHTTKKNHLGDLFRNHTVKKSRSGMKY